MRIAVRGRQHGLIQRLFGGRQFADVAQCQPEFDAESGAAAFAAADVDLAAHQLGQMLADRQTQPGAAEFSAHRSIALREWLEQKLEAFFAQADTAVFDFNTQADAGAYF